MQTDARFIEDVENTDEPRTDLGGEPDALRFTAAEGAALAVQGEIAETYVSEEAKPGADFLDDFVRNLLLKVGEL